MVQTAKLSVEEYHRIVAANIFGDRRLELIEGALIELSPETPYHANCNNRAYKYLLFALNQLADVRSGHPITLPTSEPQPDLVLARLPETLYDIRHPQPEDIYLLIEISYSTLEYDLNEKKQIYAKAGIPEYWVMDLKHQALIVFREPEGIDYRNCTELKIGQINTLAFPNISLDVDRLL